MKATRKNDQGRLKNKLESFAATRKPVTKALESVLLQKKILENKNEDLDTDDLKQLFKQASSLTLSREFFSREQLNKVKRNKSMTETLLGMRQTECSSNVTEVEVDGTVYKNWHLMLQPVAEEPDVLITQNILTRDLPGSEQLPSIHRLGLTIEGLDMDADFTAVKTLCEEDREPQLFTHLVIHYLPIIREREELIQTFIGQYCKRRSTNAVQFHNSFGEPLAGVVLSIKLHCGNTWIFSWRAALSENGVDACKSFNIPIDLEVFGTVEGWSPQYAMETLSKVARLDAETPLKNMSSLLSDRDTSNGCTPRGEPEKKAKQRKLAM